MAVFRLVNKLLNSEEGSLILLDEPEVSLHPGAQINLKYFLLNQIKEHKHQVILSTHSPVLIEDLPKEAIKVFSQKFDTGRIAIKENILPQEAFYFIGQIISDKTIIIVEDINSNKILNKILQKLGEEVANRFEIKFIPGGAKVMLQQLTTYSSVNAERYFFILDGDQKLVENIFDITNLQDKDKNKDYLKNIIQEQTGTNIKFFPDGSTEGSNLEQEIQLRINYLKYFKEHIHYLPKQNPEEIVWSEEVFRQKISEEDYNINIERIRSLQTTKLKIYESAKLLFGNENQTDAFEDILINEWIKKEDENYNIIKKIIESL